MGFLLQSAFVTPACAGQVALLYCNTEWADIKQVYAIFTMMAIVSLLFLCKASPVCLQRIIHRKIRQSIVTPGTPKPLNIFVRSQSVGVKLGFDFLSQCYFGSAEKASGMTMSFAKYTSLSFVLDVRWQIVGKQTNKRYI